MKVGEIIPLGPNIFLPLSVKFAMIIFILSFYENILASTISAAMKVDHTIDAAIICGVNNLTSLLNIMLSL